MGIFESRRTSGKQFGMMVDYASGGRSGTFFSFGVAFLGKGGRDVIGECAMCMRLVQPAPFWRVRLSNGHQLHKEQRPGSVRVNL